MATRKPSEEMSFEEFKQLMAAFPSGHMVVIDKFSKLLRSGCSEAEAKRWLMVQIWEFPEGLRNGVMAAFAEDTLEKAAEEGRQS